jgi:predicted nucleic acid-binding protein
VRAILDTNVVIDALSGREPFRAAAEKCIMGAAEGAFSAYITSNTVTDIVYVLRKSMGLTEIGVKMSDLMDICEVLAVTEEDCRRAFFDHPNMSDYEDSLLVSVAERRNIPVIITRDKSLLAQNGLTVCLIEPGADIPDMP